MVPIDWVIEDANHDVKNKNFMRGLPTHERVKMFVLTNERTAGKFNNYDTPIPGRPFCPGPQSPYRVSGGPRVQIQAFSHLSSEPVSSFLPKKNLYFLDLSWVRIFFRLLGPLGSVRLYGPTWMSRTASECMAAIQTVDCTKRLSAQIFSRVHATL